MSESMQRHYSVLDCFVMEIDQGLATVFGRVSAKRPNPADSAPDPLLSSQEKTHSGGFMRVDHTGEVCAQALYRGQMSVARSSDTYTLLAKACEEEKDHLAWTHQRLDELQTHRSYFNIYWYVHSFLIGMLAGLCGDRWSLGFVEETEKQVSRHLTHHIEHLPERDIRSRNIVAQMREDEELHGAEALKAGSSELHNWIKTFMAWQSKVMTMLAYYF